MKVYKVNYSLLIYIIYERMLKDLICFIDFQAYVLESMNHASVYTE